VRSRGLSRRHFQTPCATLPGFDQEALLLVEVGGLFTQGRKFRRQPALVGDMRGQLPGMFGLRRLVPACMIHPCLVEQLRQFRPRRRQRLTMVKAQSLQRRGVVAMGALQSRCVIATRLFKRAGKRIATAGALTCGGQFRYGPAKLLVQLASVSITHIVSRPPLGRWSRAEKPACNQSNGQTCDKRDDGRGIIHASSISGTKQERQPVVQTVHRLRASSRLAQLLQLLNRHLTLEAAEPVDEQDTFEVIHLMLQANRHHAVERFFVHRAIQILPARTDPGGALDVSVNLGDREAALVIRQMLSRRIEDLRIDEDPRLTLGGLVRVMVIAMCGADFRLRVRVIGLKIDHQHAKRYADLDRRETDAGRVVHRLEHIGDERLELVIECLDGCGDLLQARVGYLDDLTNCHPA
jgi:hypothetical protein